MLGVLQTIYQTREDMYWKVHSDSLQVSVLIFRNYLFRCVFLGIRLISKITVKQVIK